MGSKPVYEIDGSRFSTLEGFYDEVSRVLVPGAEWGHDLDAFNDILRGGFGTPDGGFILRWRNAGLSRERLGYPETVRQLRLRLRQCHPANIPHVTSQLEEAERGQGRTAFEWLLDILATHGPGGQEERDGVELVLI